MERHKNLKLALSGLAKLQITLEKNGGPESDSKLFEEILFLQSQILKSFGLPETIDFLPLVEFSSIPSESMLNEREAQLHSAAKTYLLTKAKSDVELLKDAKATSADPFNVLPELKVSNHAYTHFLYKEKFLKGIISEEIILDVFSKVRNISMLSFIGDLTTKPKKTITEEIGLLQNKGILFIDEFLDLFCPQNQEESKEDKLQTFIYNQHHRFPSLEEAFKEYANFLMNDVALVVADHPYRIIECELYYHCPTNHPDPFVHKRPNQLMAGNWYFNDSGLDITFGDSSKGIYASFLIRGIKSIANENNYITGPINVVREIFNQFGNVGNYNNGIGLFQLEKGFQKETPITSTRIGLSKSASDPLKYIEKQYRFMVELNPKHKFPGKEAAIKALVNQEKITKERAKEILGYNIS